MGRSDQGCLLAAAALTGALFNFALARPALAADQEVVLQSPAELAAFDVSIKVVHGQAANPAIWPSTLVFRKSDGAGCTATEVGSQVILTAAHCVENGLVAKVFIHGQSVQIACDHHPNYPAEITADYALCKAEANLPMPSAGFEVVETGSRRPAQNESVTLLGYGCLTEGGHDLNFGNLFLGGARITSIRDEYGFVQTLGGSAVCFGDSGGGAYYSLNEAGTIRRLFALNANGNIVQVSYLVPIAAPTFTVWATSWAAVHGVGICGLTGAGVVQAVNCRQ